jgi:hypothetical protein
MLQKARYKGLSVSKLEEVIDKTEKGLADYKIIYDTIFDEDMDIEEIDATDEEGWDGIPAFLRRKK